jgi:hypothetical protein
MFNINTVSVKKPYMMDDNLRKYLHDVSNKYIKMTSNFNEDIKKKQDIKKILYGKELIKTTNHSVNDLINNSKYYNFIFLISFISLSTGAFIFYKTK